MCLTDRSWPNSAYEAPSGGAICAGKWHPKQDDSMRFQGLQSLAAGHFLMSPMNPENAD